MFQLFRLSQRLEKVERWIAREEVLRKHIENLPVLKHAAKGETGQRVLADAWNELIERLEALEEWAGFNDDKE